MMYDKRGVSVVIATVLLILLTLVVAFIASEAAISFTQKNLQKGGECFPYKDYFKFDDSLGYTCYAKSGNSFFNTVSVKAAVGESDINNSVSGFTLVFGKGASSKVVAIARSQQSGLGKENSIWMVDGSNSNILLPQQGEIITYIYNSTNAYASVEIHPVLDSGSICPASDSIKLSQCIGYLTFINP